MVPMHTLESALSGTWSLTNAARATKPAFNDTDMTYLAPTQGPSILDGLCSHPLGIAKDCDRVTELRKEHPVSREGHIKVKPDSTNLVHS